jgi:hypothetical protein
LVDGGTLLKIDRCLAPDEHTERPSDKKAAPMEENGSLRSALWDAANTLRGSAVDRTDWKGYILPLLFFKRISEVWD